MSADIHFQLVQANFHQIASHNRYINQVIKEFNAVIGILVKIEKEQEEHRLAHIFLSALIEEKQYFFLRMHKLVNYLKMPEDFNLFFNILFNKIY